MKKRSHIMEGKMCGDVIAGKKESQLLWKEGNIDLAERQLEKQSITQRIAQEKCSPKTIDWENYSG